MKYKNISIYYCIKLLHNVIKRVSILLLIFYFNSLVMAGEKEHPIETVVTSKPLSISIDMLYTGNHAYGLAKAYENSDSYYFESNYKNHTETFETSVNGLVVEIQNKKYIYINNFYIFSTNDGKRYKMHRFILKGYKDKKPYMITCLSDDFVDPNLGQCGVEVKKVFGINKIP